MSIIRSKIILLLFIKKDASKHCSNLISYMLSEQIYKPSWMAIQESKDYKDLTEYSMLYRNDFASSMIHYLSFIY